MNCLDSKEKRELESDYNEWAPVLLPWDGFYSMGKLWFSKGKIVNWIRDLPGAGSVLCPLGEDFALSESLTTSYVYTEWLIFIIEPCDGTLSKGCHWSPWIHHHNCSSGDVWHVNGPPWQFLSHQQTLFCKYPWVCVRTAYQTYCRLTLTCSSKRILPTLPLPLWLCFDWLWMMSWHCVLFLVSWVWCVYTLC